jgi:N-methylhydantoinase A
MTAYRTYVRLTDKEPVKKPLTRLAVDIGGTFTDIVLDVGPTRYTRKVLTTPTAPEVALIEGASALMEDAGTRFSNLDLFVHGTTLATNAILERRGAKTALIATAGFRDVLEIATESRFDQYDLAIELPKPLIGRSLRFTVAERMSAEGTALLPLDLASVDAVIDQLAAQQVESVAIALLHAYANADHERAVAERIAQRLPNIAITLSSEVCPEIKEYERTSTAAANAYVQPLMSSYLGRMQQRLQEEGFAGSLYLVTSSGGLTSVETARRFPVRLVESGPAGGAIYASTIARALGETRVLAFDMGGTTAKVTIIKDFEPIKGRWFEVDRTKRFRKGSGLPIRIPVTEMVEIGAGGGSIAALDAMNNITVGPESASSEPGPACFGLGGTRPTVTDANVVLGYLDPDNFAGGSFQLQRDAAETAFQTHIGANADMDAQSAAYGVYEIVSENMASAARAHAVEMGEALGAFTMIAFGGAAPLHAARVAEKLGISRVMIPPNAGLGSAVGFMTAPIAYEVVRSQWMRLSRFNAERANALLADMEQIASDIVQPALGKASAQVERSAFMRYAGQSNELEVPLPSGALSAEHAPLLRQRFEEIYARQFTRGIPGAEVEIINWSTRIQEVRAMVDADTGKPSITTQIKLNHATRTAYEPCERTWREFPVVRRDDLATSGTLPGPALIAEKDTTTLVTAGFNVSRNPLGCIYLQSKTTATA